ncbi:pentapeptide repeat-containing protein [Micromonospora tulbaghiae]|uniref:pentapeptide repeat-containing protein n=1 Tax=Micromonospora tulbaghiae TaxID=479978 RepID=UPI0033F9D7E7
MRLRAARLELAPVAPFDVRPDPWQRLIAVGSILSVLVLAGGLYLTNDANRRQQALAAQGQITERFGKAIEQLGQTNPDKMDVRLGAIYALERIMRDSATDYPAVVQVLAGFIRGHAPRNGRTPQSSGKPDSPDGKIHPPEDIQAALDVLGRRSIKGNTGEMPFSLANTNLAGASIWANFADVSFRGADLRGANLSGTNLDDAKMAGADMRGASLAGARLFDAGLSDVNLAGADMTRADLRRAWLSNTNLSGANLTDALLTRTQLQCADVDETTILPEKLLRDKWAETGCGS